MSQSFPEELVYPALPRRSRGGPTHTMEARGTALWESLVGKPPGKSSRESHRSLDPSEGKRDTAATAREESSRAGPHSRRGLTRLGRLQKYPRIHVSTGEESSVSGTDSTQGLKPRHRRERNLERPQTNSHGDWPFLRPPERSLRSLSLVESTCRNSRKSRRFSPPGEMRPISAEASRV